MTALGHGPEHAEGLGRSEHKKNTDALRRGSSWRLQRVQVGTSWVLLWPVCALDYTPTPFLRWLSPCDHRSLPNTEVMSLGTDSCESLLKDPGT